MNRSERRAANKKHKGGCNAYINIRYGRSETADNSILKTMAKIGKQINKEKVLRSKQVPGY